MSTVERAIASRLQFLRRELEIAEREAAREPLDVDFLPAEQRRPFETVNREIRAARDAIPKIRAEISELEGAEDQELRDRLLLALHFRVAASAVNITDWPAYLRQIADGHEAGTSWYWNAEHPEEPM